MLNFDRARFLGIQEGAVALADPLRDAVKDSLHRHGVDRIFFIGAGGAGILMQPAAMLLEASSTLSVHVANPAELVATGYAQLGSQSLVVIPSLSGTTQESLEALLYCKARGATTIALTGHAGTPIGQAADVNLVNFAADDTSCESFYLQSLIIALALMDDRSELNDYDSLLAELRVLPPLLVDVKEAFESRAKELASALAAEPFHIITGAGSTWPEAFYYGMCILEEMQWMRTRPVHASDFFHGTLELVEPGVSLVVFKGEDASRPLVDRVERFGYAHTDKVQVLDTRDLALPGLSDKLRSLVSPVLLATALERVNAHLEVERAHPLTTRRYYRRIAY